MATYYPLIIPGGIRLENAITFLISVGKPCFADFNRIRIRFNPKKPKTATELLAKFEKDSSAEKYVPVEKEVTKYQDYITRERLGLPSRLQQARLFPP